MTATTANAMGQRASPTTRGSFAFEAASGICRPVSQMKYDSRRMNELRKRAVRLRASRSMSVTSCEFAMSSSKSRSCRSRELLVVHPQHELLVEPQAADVHVHRADGGDLRVDGDRLGVQEAGLVEVDLHAGLEQWAEVRPRRPEGHLLVGHAGHHEAHVDAGERRVDHRVVEPHLGDEVGRLDPDAVGGVADGQHVRAPRRLPRVLDGLRDDLAEDARSPSPAAAPAGTRPCRRPPWSGRTSAPRTAPAARRRPGRSRARACRASARSACRRPRTPGPRCSRRCSRSRRR